MIDADVDAECGHFDDDDLATEWYCYLVWIMVDDIVDGILLICGHYGSSIYFLDVIERKRDCTVSLMLHHDDTVNVGDGDN